MPYSDHELYEACRASHLWRFVRGIYANVIIKDMRYCCNVLGITPADYWEVADEELVRGTFIEACLIDLTRPALSGAAPTPGLRSATGSPAAPADR